MSSDRQLQQNLQLLFARQAHGIKPGLQAVTALLRHLGDPWKTWPSVHVAGTNGKGSLCAMLESILRGAGFRTGLYTSPHLVHFNERFRVNNLDVSDAVLSGLIEAVDWADRQASDDEGGRPATFFEFATAMAFVLFREARVEVAVVETGLGGRLDATNILHPLTSVISRIDRDHVEYLGRSLESIAAEKGGIIKPGVPVVLGAMPAEARRVLTQRAADVGAPCIPVEERVSVRRLRHDTAGQRLVLETPTAVYGPLHLPLCGRYQLENAAAAVAAAESVAESLGRSLPAEVVKEGLEQVHWPARCQWIGAHPPMVLDAAHNPGGAKALVQMLKEEAGQKPVALVFGMMQDKDVDGFLRVFRGRISRLWVVELPGDRALPTEDLVRRAQAAKLPAATASGLEAALDDARAWALEQNGIVVAAGSLILAGEVIKYTAGNVGHCRDSQDSF